MLGGVDLEPLDQTAAREQVGSGRRELGFAGVWATADVPALPWAAVIDASNAPSLPALALDLVEPGKRVVYVGLAGTPA